MYSKNFEMWPKGLPHDIEPETKTLFDNLVQSYADYGDKTALVFYETEISYNELYNTVLRLASWLTHEAGIAKGDRVGIFSQNCPQYVIAYYAILCAGGVVVPINPMCVSDELAYLLDNSGAKALFAAVELQDAFLPVLSQRDVVGVGIEYSDYLRTATQLPVPEFVRASGLDSNSLGLSPWRVAVNEARPFNRPEIGVADLAMLPYTSGSTGFPKGCMHNSLSAQHGVRSVYDWFGINHSDVLLIVAPMFHVVGLQAGINTAIACGATAVILPRWDREVAARAFHGYSVTVWPTVPSMVIDLLNMPDLDEYDISSLRVMFGGGTTMPEAVAAELKKRCGVTFLEGYGMTETCCPTTANPIEGALPQCAGLPVFNTDVRIVDHDTLVDLPTGEVGELLISGPQLLQGYWQDDEANAESFVEIEGGRYLRSGDLGYINEKGYVYVVDRIKRMINASGYKVWPSQVEATLHLNPAIDDVCVIASQDSKRGETVKAIVVRSILCEDITEEDIINWSRQHMAAYKIPRIIKFVDALPKTGSGKIRWREIQEAENNP